MTCTSPLDIFFYLCGGKKGSTGSSWIRGSAISAWGKEMAHPLNHEKTCTGIGDATIDVITKSRYNAHCHSAQNMTLNLITRAESPGGTPNFSEDAMVPVSFNDLESVKYGMESPAFRIPLSPDIVFQMTVSVNHVK